MPAIVKTDLRVVNADTLKYSITNNPTYAFISGTTSWDEETEPPIPVDSAKEENFALKTILGVKRVLNTDVISILPRTNWLENTIYDQYDNEIDLINTRNPITDNFWKFYVITEDFNVYKCLSNNYDSPSLNRPTGQNPTPFQTPDGYVWKYMYTVQASDAFKFLTVNWMPCYSLTFDDGSAQWNSQKLAVSGTIDNIILTNKGTGYTSANPPEVVITGDGEGASATAIVNAFTGEVDNIVMNNFGNGYTEAAISFLGGDGVGLEARAIIGPRQGHGFDPRVELGATYLMVKVVFDGSEGGLIATDVDYRISGLIELPKSITSTQGYAIKVTQGSSKLFNIGETLNGDSSGSISNIVHIDSVKDILYINNLVGILSNGETVFSQPYNETTVETIIGDFLPLTDQVYTGSSIDKTDGKILFIANREKITRIDQQKEEVIAILSL